MKRCVRTPAIDDTATIAPPRPIARPACLRVRNVPVRLTSRAKRHSSTEVVRTEPAAPPPAFATAMSRPSAPAAVSTAASTAASSVTSQAAVRTSVSAGASRSSSAAAARSLSAERPAIVTVAPSRRSARAHASPMPLPPPVISAVLPWRAPAVVCILTSLARPACGGTPTRASVEALLLRVEARRQSRRHPAGRRRDHPGGHDAGQQRQERQHDRDAPAGEQPHRAGDELREQHRPQRQPEQAAQRADRAALEEDRARQVAARYADGAQHRDLAPAV